MPGRRRARPAIRRGGPVRLPSWPPRTSPRADAGGARRVDPGARHAGPEARARLRRSSRGFPRAPRTRGTPARASPRRDASPRWAVAAPARMAGEASPQQRFERPLRSWSIEPRIRQYQYVVPRAALFGAIISGVLAAEAPQKPRLGASTAHSRPPHSTRALTSAVRRGSREEARSRSTGDARRVRSRGRSLPVSWSQRADDGLASSALAERDVTRASVVRIQSRETQNTVSPCRTSWRRSPRSSWR